MTLSAALMCGCGLLLTFAPAEAVHVAGGAEAPLIIAMAQICGALYLGCAILNWMASDNLIGGVYSRPVALGNFLHLFAVAIALIKALPTLPRSTVALGFLLIYVSLAVGFGLVLFRHPQPPAPPATG